MDYVSLIQEATHFLKTRFAPSLDVGMILGSGLGPLADAVENPVRVPYHEIPHFPVSTVPGHAGELVMGGLQGQTLAVRKGRVPTSEGYTMA